MTVKDLDLKLYALGWSRKKLCVRLGLHRNTPTGWDKKVPLYVEEYIRVCFLAKAVLD